MEALTNFVLLALLAAVTAGIVRVRNLFAVVVLSGAFSFLMATVLLVLDAVDVAFTEACVGAGISTVLMLAALRLTGAEEAPPVRFAPLPLAAALVAGGALAYGLGGLPPFGEAATPVHLAGPDYLGRALPETGIANVVTGVLASYRGYDTLGETTVIFTAGIAVLVLLKRRRPEESG